ncbi:MAG: phage tail protein [Deltaproteobacteria bacterium]|nr:phage tail protein [Deltaproteobacteria bacterium]
MAQSFSQWAALPDTEKVYAAVWTLQRIADGAAQTVRVATSGGVWDGSNYFTPCLIGIPSISHSAQQLVSGQTMVSFGEMELALDPDVPVAGGLTLDQFLADYAWAGQKITLTVGDPDPTVLAWDNWGVVLRGHVGGPSFDDTTVSVPLYGRDEKLANAQVPPNLLDPDGWDKWAPSTVYALGKFVSPPTSTGYYYECAKAGTSGATVPSWPDFPGAPVEEYDGGPVWTCRELPQGAKGKPRPLVYGHCYNLTPVLIDTLDHLYLVNDPDLGPIQEVVAVYDGGYRWVAGTNYFVNLANGTIKLATEPEYGSITCEVKGRRIGGVYKEKPGEIAQDLVTSFGGFTTAEVDTASVAAFNAAVPQAVGLFLDSQSPVMGAVESLLTGLTAVAGFNYAGQFQMLRFTPPAGSPALELSDAEILDFAVEPEDRLYHQARVGAGRVWTVQKEVDPVADEDWRARVAEEYVWATAQDDTVKGLYPLATTCEHGTLLYSATEGETVAAWWLALFGQRRRVLTIKLKLQSLPLDLGALVRVTRERFGLAAGPLFRVVGFAEDHQNATITMKLWG